jgi:hypothetical protein
MLLQLTGVPLPNTRCPRSATDLSSVLAGSSVSIVTRLRAGRPRFNSRWGSGGIFSLLHCIQIGSGVYPTSYPMGTGGSCDGLKRSGREADR